jgi:hypothetical protein
MELRDLIRLNIIRECNIMKGIAEEWLILQVDDNIKDDEAWERFLQMCEWRIGYSVLGNDDMFMEWIKEQRNNDLPNHSSGSTYTALTDVDGIYCNFENLLEDFGDESFREEMYELIEEML